VSAIQWIQQARLIDPVTATDRRADVLVVEGCIRAIASTLTQSDIPETAEVIAGHGQILAPGLVDLYSHGDDPGHESRETFDSLMAAAIAGGITRLGLLPTTEPPVDDAAMVQQLLSRRQQRSRQQLTPHLYLWGALTRQGQGQQMSDLAELAAAGVVGFSDGTPLPQILLLRRLLEYGQSLGKPVALWPCDRTLRADGVVRDGAAALSHGLVGQPVCVETAALAALLECAADLNLPLHIMRVSTKRGVDLIRQAKAAGIAITASTTWHHLVCNSQALGSYDPCLRLEPPLGNPSDQAALIAGVQQGTIDAVAIDHTPYTYEEKTVAFSAAPPGAIGLELALPVLWHTLVEPGHWSALTLWRCLSTAPAQCWGQPPATLQRGHAADMVLFNPQASWTVTAKTLKSAATNTAWLGQTISGQVQRLWIPRDVEEMGEDRRRRTEDRGDGV